jgi:hypothetical protein
MPSIELIIATLWIVCVLWIAISAFIRNFLFPSSEREEQLKLLSEGGECLEHKYHQQVCE